MATTHTLSIDFGSKYIGVALVSHSPKVPNRVLYAAVILVQPKPLNAAIKPRAAIRRIRRTRKTHARRLRRLAQALDGIPGADEVLRFCRRRGYSHDADPKADGEELAYAVSRNEFFAALATEIDRVVPENHREYVLARCQEHLNAERRQTAEIRPARFENRHPTRCQWEGCAKNVARKVNATREQLSQTLFVWLKPAFDQTHKKRPLREAIQRRIDRLVGLARGYGKDPDQETKKVLSKQKRRCFAGILEAVDRFADEETAQQFSENWKKTYSRQFTEILTKKQGGRLRYCRRHSHQFVDLFLAGKQPPHGTEVHMPDLFGRSQQILFQRIWRLVAARILPLAGNRIDRVVVERVAFDILAGPFKQRTEVREDRAAEMYWHGPMYGFGSRREMLKEEFDGRCAYCGRRRSVGEIEHLLPKSRFPFDSYFNILPACRECNQAKGARTPSEVGMTVHQEAYAAFADYVSKKNPPHLYHTIKKGMLKLMTRGGSMATAQRQLGLLADNLVSITNTQKSPRPLARFLADRISRETDRPCQPDWLSGRHTALYREIVLPPEYDKKADKRQNGLVNHAVDAIVAGCKFPSAAALENPRWSHEQKDIHLWREKVLAAATELSGGLPKVEPIERIEFFENDLEHGYLHIDLSAFNWNRQRKSGFKQDPFGATAQGEPLKRKPADEVLANLLSDKDRNGQIESIAHPGLRRLLESRPEEAARLFVDWLQKTTRRGFARAKRGTHPSDKARYAPLEAFSSMPVEDFIRKKTVVGKAKSGSPAERETIPPTIGIRCINKGVRGKLTVTRLNGADGKVQRFAADPQYREWYVGYRDGDDGLPVRTEPMLFAVNQGFAVKRKQGRAWVPVTDDEASILNGVHLGARGDRKLFSSRWRSELESVFQEQGIVKWFRVTQGCYIEKTDGTGFQLRSFDDKKAWMKNGPFENIHRVYRSPLSARR